MGFWSRVKERMKTRNPWIAGALNFVTPGLGYLFAGRKKTLGLSLVAMIGAWITLGGTIRSGIEVSPLLFYGAGYGALLFVCFAFARDAYIEAEKRNEGVESE